MKYRYLSLFLLLAVFATCFGAAFITEASAAVDTSDLVVADWLNAGTVNDRGADTIMSEYADAGITDVYLLVKGTAGRLAWASTVSGTVQSYSSDILKATCTAAKKYGIRVHAWMMAARDDTYIANHSGAIAWHFRVGNGSAVNQYINLRDSGYQSYMTSLVKELVANYDIAGIHLDTIRYGALYYDWGQNARENLIANYGITKDEYNAATLAMCVSGGYKYSTNSDGYYIYNASGTSASGVNFAQAFAGSGSTNAKNGAKKFMQMRIDTVTNFVKVIKDAAGDKIISAAIMPEGANDDYSAGVYGQSPASLKNALDYVCVMSYASQYGGASTWPASLAKACASVGCNAVAAIQTFDCENTNADPTCTDIYNECTNVMTTRASVNSDASFQGKVLGYAFFRGAKMCMAGAYVKDSSTLNFSVHNQDEAGTSVTKLVFTMKNGVTIQSVSNKSGWGSSTFTISSDKKTLTISNSSGALGKYGSGTFTVTYSGTISETAGACMLTAYNSSGEDYAYCRTIYPSHTHSYTSSVTKAATCTTDGVKTYRCSCGASYTEAIKSTGHNYSNNLCTKCGDVHDYDLLHFKADSDEIKWSWQVMNSPTTAVTYSTTGDGYMVGTTGDNTSKWTNYFIVQPSGTCSYQHTICANDVAQVRFRWNVTSGATGTVTPDFRFYKQGETSLTLWSENATQTANLSSTGWQTITVPLVSTNYQIGETINRIAFAPFKGRSDVAAKVEIDYIYIGQPENAPDQSSVPHDDLLDFTAGSKEISWDWQLANAETTAVSYDTTGNGSMLGTSSANGKIQNFLVWQNETCSYQHTICARDVAQVRYRYKVTSNSSGLTTVKPDFRFHTEVEANFQDYSGNATQTVSLSSTAWQTVTIPIPGSVYTAGTTIDRILFSPFGGATNIAAEIEVDYIYVGQPSGAPIRTALYDGDLYDFQAGGEENGWQWKLAHGVTDAVTIDTTGNGSISGTTSSDSANSAPYFLVWQNGTCSYQHTLQENDVAQVRFRWKTTSYPNSISSVVPDFRFNMDGNVTENFRSWTKNATESISLDSNDWHIVTIPIVGANYKAGETINRILFAPFGANNAIGATVEVDYIYVGHPEEAPACIGCHTNVETWATGASTHMAYCYNCRSGVKYPCYFVETARVEATCKANGYATYVCGGHLDENGELVSDTHSGSGCGNTYTETLTASTAPDNGHSYTSKVTKQPTCTAAGTRTYTCTRCGGTYSKAIPATGHTEVIDAAVAPTCTTAGKTEGKHCSVCKAVIVAQKEVAAAGHAYKGKITTPPTCTTPGVKTFTCSVCKDTYASPVDAAGHVEAVDAAVAPTCTATGKTEGKHCSVCNEILVAQKDVAATGHREVVDAAVPATCTSAGKTAGKHCSVCNKVLVTQETVAKLGHKYDYKITTAPTCTESGEKTFTCSVCSSSYTEPVDATGHVNLTYADNGDGTHDAVCLCGLQMIDNEAHTFVNNACTCGATVSISPTPAVDLKFASKSLSLQSYTAFKLMAKYSVLDSYDSYYAVFTREDASTGSTDTLSTAGAVSTASANYHAFEYPVYAYALTDEITATLYGVKDGVTYAGETYTTSVRDYVLSKIGSAKDSMKAVYANLLYYGAHTQKLMNYKTDDLATTGLGSYKSYITTTVPSTSSVAAGTIDGYNKIGLASKALGLNAAVEIQFVLKKTTAYTQDQLYAVYSFERNGKTVTGRIDGENFALSSGYWVIKVNALTAMEGKTPVSVTVYSKANDSRLSETWTYSIESHVNAKVTGKPTTTQQYVLVALMNYYNAVEAAYK